MKRTALLLGVGFLLLGAELDPPGTEVVVAFNRARFEPALVEVRLGAWVTFHNIDAGEIPLTLVASDGSFESWPLPTHGEWSRRFGTRGEHGVSVKGHPETQGKVVVR